MKKSIIIVSIALAAFAGVLLYVLSKPDSVTEETAITKTKRVEAQAVQELQTGQSGVISYGQVVSVTGVDVVPEIGGIVKRVNKRLGDTVRAGDVVLELQNSSQAQQVAQAQASLASAQASFAKISGDAGVETIAQAQSSLASQKSALAATEQQTLTSLDALYTGLENTLNTQIDDLFFSNTNTDFPDLRFDGSTTVKEEALEQQRAQLEVSLEQGRNYQDVDQALKQYINKVQQTQSLVDAVLTEVGSLQVDASLSLNTIQGWQADMALVTSTLSGYTSQTAASIAALDERRQAVTSAEVTLAELENGADADDVAVARAGVAQAQAGLQSAQIAFGKTRIKAPVFGKISQLDIRVGSLVGQGAPVFVIANENTLRVDTKVTVSESASLSINDQVSIDNAYTGYISVISPSIDEQTGKVTVQILLEDQNVRLPSGSGVGLVFNVDDSASSSEIRIPIEAVFVRGEQSYVYVLNDNKAVPREIQSDSLFGKTIVVSSGLESADVILLSARGVKDNETVELVNSN